MSRLFDLDAVVAGARHLCDRLLRGSEPYGCFRWRNEPLPNLLYLNDVVMLLWMIGELPEDPDLRARWAATLNRFQCPEGGAYGYPPFAKQSWQHATMNTVIALNMLGARPAHPLAVLQPLRDVDTCRRWVESHTDPHTAIPHHRYGLGAVLMHSSPPPPGWTDAFLAAIRRLQDPENGLFPSAARGGANISATFMFAKILLNAGGDLPRAEAMFDALLAAQRTDGAFTDHDAVGYHDMDAAFLLAHVAERHGYRRADARAALRRLAARLGCLWQREGPFRCDPHEALALLSLGRRAETRSRRRGGRHRRLPRPLHRPHPAARLLTPRLGTGHASSGLHRSRRSAQPATHTMGCGRLTSTITTEILRRSSQASAASSPIRSATGCSSTPVTPVRT